MFPRIDKGPIEYTLHIFRTINEKDRTPVIRFHFETTEEFHYFRYQLTIDSKHQRDALSFRIKGLKPQLLAIPQDGNARADVDLPVLTGRFSVKVTKPGDVANTFDIHIDAREIRLADPDNSSLTFLHVTFQEN